MRKVGSHRGSVGPARRGAWGCPGVYVAGLYWNVMTVGCDEPEATDTRAPFRSLGARGKAVGIRISPSARHLKLAQAVVAGVGVGLGEGDGELHLRA